MELVRLGKVEPIVGARYGLERLAEALRRAHDADVFGRIMLDVADE